MLYYQGHCHEQSISIYIQGISHVVAICFQTISEVLKNFNALNLIAIVPQRTNEPWKSLYIS